MMIKTGDQILEDILSESGTDFKSHDTGRGLKFVVDTPAKLNDLINGLGPEPKHRNRGMVVLKFEKLSRQKNLEWEEKLNRTYFSCGCGQGKIGLCIALATGIALWLFQWQGGITIANMGLFAAWVISGGLLGKWTGLVLDRMMFREDAVGLKGKYLCQKQIE